MKKLFMKKNGKKSKGQSLVEYGLILALVSVVAITVLQTMGSQIKTTVGGLTTKLEETKWSGLCVDSGGSWIGLKGGTAASIVLTPAWQAVPAAFQSAITGAVPVPCVCPPDPVTNIARVYQDPGTIAALGGKLTGVQAKDGKCF